MVDLPADIIGFIDAGRIIDAIKAYRDRFGVSLTEAKDAIDCFRAFGIPIATGCNMSEMRAEILKIRLQLYDGDREGAAQAYTALTGVADDAVLDAWQIQIDEEQRRPTDPRVW